MFHVSFSLPTCTIQNRWVSSALLSFSQKLMVVYAKRLGILHPQWRPDPATLHYARLPIEETDIHSDVSLLFDLKSFLCSDFVQSNLLSLV